MIDARYLPGCLMHRQHGTRPTPINWFMVERAEPLPFQSDLVQDYDELPPHVQSRVQQLLQELLTYEEANELRPYIKNSPGYQCQEGRVPLPLYPIRQSLAGDGYIKPYHAIGEQTDCEFYKLCDHDDYPFDFKVWGHWVIFG